MRTSKANMSQIQFTRVTSLVNGPGAYKYKGAGLQVDLCHPLTPSTKHKLTKNLLKQLHAKIGIERITFDNTEFSEGNIVEALENILGQAEKCSLPKGTIERITFSKHFTGKPVQFNWDRFFDGHDERYLWVHLSHEKQDIKKAIEAAKAIWIIEHKPRTTWENIEKTIKKWEETAYADVDVDINIEVPRRYIKWNDEKIAELKRLVDEEKTCREIAEAFKTTWQTIYRQLTILDLHIKTKREKKITLDIKWSNTNLAKLEQLLNEGKTKEETAKAFNTTEANIQKITSLLGLKFLNQS